MKGILCAGAAFLTLLSFSTITVAQDIHHPWHAGVYLGKGSLDGDRPTDNGDIFYGIGIGRFLGEDFSIDLEHDRVYAKVDGDALQAAFPGATFDEWNLKTTSLTGRLFFGESDARPFVAFGLSYVDHRSIFDEGGNLGFQVGAGIDGYFTDNFSGRFQVMFRNDRDGDSILRESSFNDVFFTLGLNWHWGGTAPPPPPPPDPDSDGDGVPDSRDRCPNTPRGTAVDEHGCPLDSDGDGVLNDRDKCPDTRPGAVVDLDGCEVEEKIELRGVNFEFDSDKLTDDSIGILDQAVAILRKHPDVEFTVAGHTDSKGPEDYNQGLSERRARTVMAYLASQGISADRMTAVGYGESKPIASNDTDAGRAKNRRTELVIKD